MVSENLEERSEDFDLPENNSGHVTKLALGIDFAAGFAGSLISYKILNTYESVGYGFLVGAGIGTIGQIVYTIFRKN